MIRKPILLLADEPTGNLDEDNAEMISQLLLELPKEENTMLLIVTHSPVLASRMDMCFELKRGLIRERSRPEAV
jgi:ABC-type lipoprotein export system ATPase subunit